MSLRIYDTSRINSKIYKTIIIPIKNRYHHTPYKVRRGYDILGIMILFPKFMAPLSIVGGRSSTRSGKRLTEGVILK